MKYYSTNRQAPVATLEEAVVNQATVWPESGADRAASSREKQVPFFAQGKGFRENQKSFFVIRKGRSREQRICR